MDNNIIYCKSCGAQNDANSKFCMNCGSKLGGKVIDAIPIQDTFNTNDYNNTTTVDDSLRAALIDKKAYHYIEKFNKIDAGKLTLNWPAFFFGTIWLLYRKMYLEFFAALFLSSIIAQISVYANAIVSIVFLFTGNILYKYKIERLEAKANSLSGNAHSKFIEKKGGASLLIPILMFMLGILIVFLLIIFAYGSFTSLN